MKTERPTDWSGRDDALVEAMIRGGASRRDLLKLLMASGVGLAAGGALIGSAGRAVAATPRDGGHIKAAGFSASTSDTLDPAKASLSTDYVRCCAFYNRLTFLNETGNIDMELAESLKSDDAQTWEVKLKKGVLFHDGHTLSADDVVFSLKRHQDPAVGSKVASIAKQMTTIEKVDPLTVKIVLAAANADLPTILALHHFMIVADGTTNFNKGNGTGPFLCESFEPGVKSVAVKNPHYFKPKLPHLDSFEFFAITDDSARVNALIAGDIAVAAAVNPRSLQQLKSAPSVKTLVSNAGNYTDLNLRLDLSPGDKPGFVEAMKYLVDRETIIKAVLRGLGEIGNDQPIAKSDRYHNPNIKPKAYDPDKAKFLFKKSGMLGETVPIVASTAAGSSVDMAMVVQQSGDQIGMKFNIERKPAAGYWSDYWLKAPIHFGNINPRPTPDILFSLLYASNAPWNESRF
ncbi:MAG: ABC transporter substrate-binding protein, partial [Pseudolabrys sp.]